MAAVQSVRSSTSGSLRWRAAALGLAWLFGAESARADGAFPDASRILLPPGRSDAITLATNFGLIATTDGGSTWIWSCETPLVNGGRGYQLAADSGGGVERVVALSSWGLVHSDDAGCSWSPSAGAGKDDTFSDLFVSATSPAAAWALGIDPEQAIGLAQVVFASIDGAATLSGPLFQAGGDAELLGVESAASDPATVYLTLANGPDAPSMAISQDGGGLWATRDLAGSLGSGYLRILAVDGRSADTVYIRQSTAKGDRLLVTRDGGRTWEVALSTGGSFSAFLQRGDGTLLLGVLEPDGKATGYRSADAGRTFLPWPGVPHLRALAERDGVLFAATDDSQDGFALATSADGGATFLPRLRYAQVSAVAACVRSDCRVTCERLAELGLWSSSLCAEPATTSAVDGSAPNDAGRDDGGDARGPDAAEVRSSPDGGCAVARASSSRVEHWDELFSAFALLTALGGQWSSRRKRRRGH